MANFEDRWTQKKKEPITNRIREKIIPQEPLRKRLMTVQQSLDREIAKLDKIDNNLKKKDEKMMKNVVASMEKHDEKHASTQANELSESRKMMRMTSQSKMVLEQISLRLGTISELGDAVTVLTPILPVIKGLKGGMSGIIPNAGSEIDEISESLNNLLVDSGNITGSLINFEANSEDAKSIIAEASAIAEQKKSDNLPNIPPQNANPIQTNPDFTL